MNLHIKGFSAEEEFWSEALRRTVETIHRAIDEHGHARIGLAGGSTPKKLYERLAQEALPWNKITWILLDERYVPEDDEESNSAMIRKALFEPAKIPHETQVFFETQRSAPEAALEMSKKIQHLLALRSPLFDLLILGAGADGHIASLFEGDVELFTPKWAYATEAPKNYATTQRLTLSLKSLTQSEKCLLLLKGEGKRLVLEALQGEPVLPITALKFLVQKVPIEVLGYFEG